MSDTPAEIISKNPQNTFITATSTGLVTLSTLIPDKVWSKVCALASPAIALITSIVIRSIFHGMQCRRGVKTYENIIKDLQAEFDDTRTTKVEKAKILIKINKFKEDVIKLKEDNIKIIIK